MRGAKTSVIILALLLFGCRKPLDFDQRYTAAQRKLEASAASIDNEIVASASASDAAAATIVGSEKSVLSN